MLNFFRRIRRSLIIKSNAKKYIIYAMGEVLLVVVGILIALQVNNWNEYRKDRGTELQALNDLKEEFLINQEEFEKHVEFKNEVASEWQVFLDKISNEKLPASGKTIVRPRLATRSYKASNGKLSSLYSSGNIDKIRNDSLYHLLSRWDLILQEYEQSLSNQISWGLEHLLPYEITLIPLSRGVYEEIGIEFYAKPEVDQFVVNANNDLTYQNLLIRNFFILMEQLATAAEIKATFKEIIRLLDEEIMSF